MVLPLAQYKTPKGFYLNRIHTFLITDEKSQVFPFLTKAMEDMLVNIADDTDFLKQGQLDDDCKSLAAQITTVLEKNKETFTLSYRFTTNENGKKLLVYMKKPVSVFKEPMAIKPLRKPNFIQATSQSNVSKTNMVMSSFKTTCLNSTLRFVKNDSQLSLQYPDMTTEQSEFVKHMISQCLAPREDMPGVGFKGLYDPLVETLKIFGLKYEFKLTEAVAMHSDMKGLKFEKIPKKNRNKEEKKQSNSVKSSSEQSLHQVNKLIVKPPPNIRHVHEIQGSKTNLQITVNTTPKTKTENNKTFDKNVNDKTENMTGLDKNTSNAKSKTENTKGLDNNKSATKSILKTEKTEKNIVAEDVISIGDSSFSSTNSDKSSKRLKNIQPFITSIKNVDEVFKKNSIFLINEFLTGTKETLVFAQVCKNEAGFLKHWKSVVNRIEVVRMFDVEDQMVLDQIRHAATTKNFKVNVVEQVSNNNRSVTFMKGPRHKTAEQPKANTTQVSAPKVASKTTTDGFNSIGNSSVSSNSKQTDNKPRTNLDAKTENFLNQIRLLTEDWIRTILIQFKEFIIDESQASLLVPRLTYAQAAFLLRWKSQLSVTAVIETFQSDVQVILSDIRRALSRIGSTFTISIKEGKVTKTQLRDITLTKIPAFPPKQPVKSTSNDNGIKAQTNTAKAVPVLCKVPEQQIKKSVSVTSLTLPVERRVEQGRPKSANVVPRAKAKLIEALSQPLVSEKGLKMMKCMGWEGGALGARGDGIVEPIMPSLDNGKRAGLGSIKATHKLPTTTPPSNITRVSIPNQPQRAELNTRFLQTILSLLQERRPATELSFATQLPLKSWSFVRHIVYTLNIRAKLSMESSSDNGMCIKISEIMQQCDHIITACWGLSKRNILFILSERPYQPTSNNSKDWCSIINIDINSTDGTSKGNANEARGKLCSETVVVDGEPFRCYVLAQILDFCLNVKIYEGPSKGKVEKVISLKGKMTNKQLSFIRDVIVRLNRRSRASSDSRNECVIFDEIVTMMQGFNLDVDFPLSENTDVNKPLYKSIRLQKIFDGKSATNSQNKPTAGKASKISEPIESIDKIKINNCDETAQNTKTEKDPKNTQSVNKSIEKRITLRDTFVSNAPNNSQKPSNNTQSAPNNTQSAPHKTNTAQNHNDFAVNKDCTRLLDDKNVYSDSDIIETARRKGDKYKRPDIIMETESVEYILINKESVETLNNLGVTISKPIVIENDTENDRPKSDKGENNRPMITEIDKTRKCEKTNMTAVVSENERSKSDNNKSDKEENNAQIVTDKVEITRKNLATADVHLECAENLLKEFVEQSQCDLISALNINKDGSKKKDTKVNEKRLTSIALTPEQIQKRNRYENYIKHISITPHNYPQNQINKKMAAEIQKSIAKSIDHSLELPLLKCHGLQDGALLYSCHTEKSLLFIENVIKSLDLEITVKQKHEIRHKMAFKINTYIEESVDTIFERLEKYNSNLNTKDWEVVKKEQGSGFIVIHVEMDENSFEFIRNEKCTLFTGLDEARFSIVWA